MTKPRSIEMEHITVGRSWSLELRVSLIRAIKPRERLWRKGGGHDSDTRMTLWAEVQDIINKEYDVYIDIDELKKTWKNLKDNFLRVKKTVAAGGCTSKPSKSPKKWFFFDELQFLENTEGVDYKNFPKLAPDLETEGLTIEPPKKRCREDQLFVSIPEIDCRIETKQSVPSGAIVLDLDGDLGEILKLTVGKWGTAHPKCTSLGKKSFDFFDEPCSSSTYTPPIEEKPIIGFTISPKGKEGDGQLLSKIMAAIPKIRGEFQKATVVYLRKKGINTEKMMQILDDFDNYIYHGRPYTEDMRQVLKSCLKSKQAEFEQLFYLVEKYRNELFLGANEGGHFNGEESSSIPDPREHINLAGTQIIDKNIVEKFENERKIMEVQRELDRINAELSGQPSVIRRTKLKKSLAESRNKLMKLIMKCGEIQPVNQESISPWQPQITEDLICSPKFEV